ncbi:ABC transporter ATP-binding protein [Planococcus sp. CAU13]|uniref:ABC transporter ATP-binding protein n=1 Tax=Planococcus sp. CAU13 TaxID=1541197 RepID=UPI00052FF606|nr:ABC transporter ATP-binding protein [Planococcus sp. CAU13]
METVIAIEHLSKRFKDVQAVENLSLELKKGEIYGFIGLNGSGKTTTIRMMLGMIKPTEGSCSLFGKKVSLANFQLWEKVGYLVETPYAYPELTVEENLDLFRRLRQIKKPDAVGQIIDKLKLTPYAKRKAKHLSLGNAQRLGIAKAMMHEPDILILDEPVNGLDPAGIVEVRELLRDLASNQGISIFLSSHLLSEVALIADKIGIIHHGRLVEEFETNELNSLIQRKLLVATRNNRSAADALTEQGMACLLDVAGFIEIREQTLLDRPEIVSAKLAEMGFPPRYVNVKVESLESYFMRSIKGKEAE